MPEPDWKTIPYGFRSHRAVVDGREVQAWTVRAEQRPAGKTGGGHLIRLTLNDGTTVTWTYRGAGAAEVRLKDGGTPGGALADFYRAFTNLPRRPEPAPPQPAPRPTGRRGSAQGPGEDFEAEYTVPPLVPGDPPLTVAVDKVGGGTVGRHYTGRWHVRVTLDGRPILDTDDLDIPKPSRHVQAAREAARFLAADPRHADLSDRLSQWTDSRPAPHAQDRASAGNDRLPVPGGRQIAKAEAVRRLRHNAGLETDPDLARSTALLADRIEHGEAFRYEWTDAPDPRENTVPTPADVKADPRYWITGPGHDRAMAALCPHGYRLVDSCPNCY